MFRAKDKVIKQFFPYREFRKGQREIINFLLENIGKNRACVIEGPNGMGKTISVLAGALSVVKRSASDKKIIFCSRTHKQVDRVIEEANKIYLKMRGEFIAIPLRGRNNLCINEHLCIDEVDAEAFSRLCDQLKKSENCPFFSNLTSKKVKALNEIVKPPKTAYSLFKAAKNAGICPYEMLQRLLPHAKIISLNYAYILNPFIREIFLKNINFTLKNAILVFDEAHNLPEITSNIFKKKISLKTLMEAEKEARLLRSKDLLENIETLRNAFRKMLRRFPENTGSFQARFFIKQLWIEIGKRMLSEIIDDLVSKGVQLKLKKALNFERPYSALYKIGVFLRYLLYLLDEAVVLIHKTGKNKTLETLLPNPSFLVSGLIKVSKASIFLSGTLKPFSAFIDVMNLPRNKTVSLEVPFPFKKENIFSIFAKGVTTRFTMRKREMYEKIALKIAEAVNATDSNTGVFFSSYEVLKEVVNVGFKSLTCKPLFIEEEGKKSVYNDKLIKEFKSFSDKGGAVLLGVMGGRNAEGEDFPGREMSTAVIIGVPFARPSHKTLALIKYYRRRFPGKGMFYGYTLPALRKVNQACGRPLRKINEKVSIVFLDDRFLNKEIFKLLSPWIIKNHVILKDEPGLIEKALKKFFQ